MRNTGRTSIMLHRAVADALEGQRVMVVAANRNLAEDMYTRVAGMQTPKAFNNATLCLEYGDRGLMTFVVDTPNRVRERAWDGKIVVDHYVFEML